MPSSLLQRRTAAPIPSSGAHASDAVSARGLSKRFGHISALNGASLDVGAGDLVALLGASGCGKTTLLRCISGLDEADAGEIWIGDQLAASPRSLIPAERRRVGMVFQDFALFPHLTVERNVGFALSRRERRSGLVEDLLCRVGLEGLGARMPGSLSGGQQQRVALARALAHRPSVILLDEPFSGLDSSLRAQVRHEVRDLLRALGVTTLFVTHDQEEAFELGDEIAIMVDGVVEQQGSAAELYDRPATRSVAAFIGDANILAGLATGSHADTPVGPVPLADESIGRADVVVRPERLEIEPGDEGTVLQVEFYGHDTTYRVKLDGRGSVTVRTLGGPRLREGDRVEVSYQGPPAVSFVPAPAAGLDLGRPDPLAVDLEHAARQALGRD